MTITTGTPDGTFLADDEDLHPILSAARRAGGHVTQSKTFRPVSPTPEYQDQALAELRVACTDLGLRRAYVAFVEAVGERRGLGYAGWFTAEPFAFRETIFIVADRTPFSALRRRVRHEAFHLAYYTQHGDSGGGHVGPSEDGAQAFENT